MAYTPTTWHDGDTITAEKLNKIEAGFAAKADKAPPATAGNLATLDASGNLVDSGKQPTAAGIGAAPAGYGYGDTMTSIVATTTADFDTQLANIYGAMPDMTCRQLTVQCPELEKGYYTFCGTLYRSDSNYGWLKVMANYNGLTVQKTLNSGTWGEWEWLNPPMKQNIEYRTTSRFNEKPVYAMLLYVTEASANKGTVSVHSVIPNATLIHHTGYLGAIPMPHAAPSYDGYYNAESWSNENTITLECGAGMTGRIWRELIYYTKEAWN